MSSQTAAQANPRKQQELQNQYTVYKNTLQQIAQKIGDVEQEAEEHKLVLETLQPLSGDRKAFRLINGVLMEQTVQDVMPALKTNSEGLKKVLEDLVKQYKTKQDELEKWKKKHNIQVVQSLVLETLQPLSGDRKAFRLINGVLMEQTVQDVMPALKTNSEGLKKVLEDLVKQYKTKQDELEKWKKKHNIQVVQS
ncbi:prefoldin subunit 2 like protein [Verticillium longisporum]|nr:prefoldin subunit 2 like protein [Verticillium longisporum]